ncbi:hypothetical protein V8C34DRAFT_269614 [Trichoderma compactum]
MASICASTATADRCLYKCICEVAASTGSHRSSLSSVSICPCDVGHGRASSATACLGWHRARQERQGSRKAFHTIALLCGGHWPAKLRARAVPRPTRTVDPLEATWKKPKGTCTYEALVMPQHPVEEARAVKR